MYQAKNWTTEHSEGNKTVPGKVANHVQRMDTDRLPKRALQLNRKDEETQHGRGGDGGINFNLMIKEHETRLTIQECDDDDDEK